MDKWQAQQNYWESFGLTAYDANTVPDDAQMPYITYEAVSGSLDGMIPAFASLWYRSNSWSAISQKQTEMSKTMDRQIKIDGGYMKVRRPSANEAQRMDEPSDPLVRRILLNVEIEFLSE